MVYPLISSKQKSDDFYVKIFRKHYYVPWDFRIKQVCNKSPLSLILRITRQQILFTLPWDFKGSETLVFSTITHEPKTEQEQPSHS